MRGLAFLKGCAIAIFGFLVMRLRDPIIENKPYNTSVDWFDILLVVGFGVIYYLFLEKSRAGKV